MCFTIRLSVLFGGLDENEIVVLGANLNGHIGVEALRYEGIQRDWCYSTQKTEDEKY